jgi:hypothetical protein
MVNKDEDFCTLSKKKLSGVVASVLWVFACADAMYAVA